MPNQSTVRFGFLRTLSNEHSDGSDFISQYFFIGNFEKTEEDRKFPIRVALHPESEESRVVASETGFGEASRASAQPASSPATGWVKHWNKES